ncbi:MAG: HigA family addiction module antidote protein [Bacteroidales bacterium]|nr:addiction module antidote protein, HigA family [Lentimicrobiaceae bacterium]MBQ3594140.1 HigA family addiction module antidote protein [Bacteroidales bacterium]
MATNNNRLTSNRAIHPGEILREELKERGIKQKDFAKAIGWQATHLNEFIKGKRNLNEDLAMRLESQLGIPFKTWMSLHSGYIYECKALEKNADYKMISNKLEPSKPVHPGEVLREELENRGISQKKFSEQIGIPYKNLNDILNCRKPITENTALLLEAALGIPAHILIGLQTDYNMQVIKQDPSFLERLANIRKMAAML